ncbi:MAG: substrate-binding domain-containing protein [Thermoguttaceae bacterium]|nr:substrate-binding domain-containing protein [Thermoguttaceae bacterium]
MSIQGLATAIEEDIQRRRLSAGDRYFTSAKMGQFFKVHPRKASRAMMHLAKRGILVRRPGAGTFIGPNHRVIQPVRIEVVHLLMSSHRPWTALPMGGFVEGVMQATGDRAVCIQRLPARDELSYLRELLAGGKADGSLQGLLLLGCGRQIQEAVLAHNVPAVVVGGVFTSTSLLPSIDLDQYASGEMAAQYMVRRGHRHLGLICGETWLPGDNAFFEGVNRVLHEARGLRPRLTTRSVPMEHAVATAEVRQLLARQPRPTGLICRGRFLTEAACHAAGEARIAIPGDLDVLLAQALVPRKSDRVYLAATKSWRSISRMAGRMLVRQIEKEPLKTPHRTVPVRLVENGRATQPGVDV